MDSWNVRRFGRLRWPRKISLILAENLPSLASSQGGMSDHGGDQRDFVLSLGVGCVNSSSCWWTKKIRRLKSRSKRESNLETLYGGVLMNFIPRPRTVQAIGGTILFGVRSWKVSFELL